MNNKSIKRLPKNTVEIKVTIAQDEIKKEYDKAFETLQRELTVEGYRKGKAPKSIAEKHLSKEAVYQQLIKTILPHIYESIVKEEKLKPVISPKIELVKAKEGEDWEIKMTVAEKPEVDLNNYKEAIKEAKEKGKKADIWVPGKEPEQKENKEMEKQRVLNSALSALLEKVKCEISELMLEEELDQRLARLLDDIQKIGLTAEAYLKSKGTTMEQMKEKMKKEVEETYKLEFILSAIADSENITIDQKDMDVLFANIKDEKERKAAQENAYFYASILRKQKTLEFIASL